jgi:hypothetical protein
MIWAGCYIDMSLLYVGNYLGNFVAGGIAHADTKARVSGKKEQTLVTTQDSNDTFEVRTTG